MGLAALLEHLMQNYVGAQGQSFGKHPLHTTLHQIEEELKALPAVRDYPELKVKGSLGQGNWATIPWIAFLDSRVAPSMQNGVYVVFLFAADMTRVYLTLNQGVTEVYDQLGAKKAKPALRSRAEALRQRPDIRTLPGFQLNWDINLGVVKGTGVRYVDSTIAYKAYERTALPADDSLAKDIEAILRVYRAYAIETSTAATSAPTIDLPPNKVEGPGELPLEQVITQAYQRITRQGFFYPPQEFAAFCVSLKSKPFVLLAGISGTGKTRLVELLAHQFGVHEYTIAVRPDWSDSTDLLGYRDLQGHFRPGPLLEILREANAHPDVPYFICLDEMNLARVEHYFAEFLSIIEKRNRQHGKVVTPPVLGEFTEAPWSKVYVSDNVFFIGTVNMDETTHPFSRKVLDRANVFEFNHVNLSYHAGPGTQPVASEPLDWHPLRPVFCRLPEFYDQAPALFEQTIASLEQVNAILEPGYFQVGYRVRDEVCLFLLHAREAGLEYDLSFDMQLHSKILPRVQGSSNTTRQVLVGLWNWTPGVTVSEDDPDLVAKVAEPPEDARYPRTARKIGVMLRRFEEEGYTSYWM